MRCQQAQELFSDYVTEEIEPALVVTLESHLSGCMNCREEADGLRQLWGRLDQVELIEAPSSLHEQIMARVSAAQEKPAPVVTPNRGRWDLRSLTQPRALAFAAAALILALASVEVVQTQRAAIGPLGFVLHLLRPAPTAPAPALQTLRGEWVPKAEGGGTLILRLQLARAATANHDTQIPYRIQIAGIQSAETQGTLTGDTETTLNIPLAQNPTGDALHVSLLLTPAEGDAQRREITVSLPNNAGNAQ